MKDYEYKEKLSQAFLLARLLMQLESLPELLEMIGRSESIGPFVDPTAWMKASDMLEQHKVIVRALLTAKIECDKAKESMIPIIAKLQAEDLVSK